MTSRHPFSIRISLSQKAMIEAYGAALGLDLYQAGVRVFEAGLASLVMPGAVTTSTGNDLIDALGDISAAVRRMEAMTDRALFTAVCAYVYAQRTALKGEADPSKINQALAAEAAEAYQRQRTLAQKTQVSGQS
ncbi:hypothetical protein [Asticcacaulis excentricus]|uniref:hypothetical protein n=1 Tax=Asticcacaulis excentricus TaxID=78587 RepID=UPI000F83D192|nr:hypothetical protein [Asticcacaulis excentricus]